MLHPNPNANPYQKLTVTQTLNQSLNVTHTGKVWKGMKKV